jgi:hypothetical protein
LTESKPKYRMPKFCFLRYNPPRPTSFEASEWQYWHAIPSFPKNERPNTRLSHRMRPAGTLGPLPGLSSSFLESGLRVSCHHGPRGADKGFRSYTKRQDFVFDKPEFRRQDFLPVFWPVHYGASPVAHIKRRFRCPIHWAVKSDLLLPTLPPF